MSDQELEATLAKLDCLQGVTQADLTDLAEVSKLVSFPAGAVIFREGDAATSTYMVVSGAISLEICAPGVGCRRILTVGPGDLLGWTPALEAGRLTATARAMEPSLVVQAPGEEIRELCESSPRFGFQFMKRIALTLARRLSAARMQLLDVYGAETAAHKP